MVGVRARDRREGGNYAEDQSRRSLSPGPGVLYTQAASWLFASSFDFARYVAARKGEAAAQLREGAAYAYGGDLKVRADAEQDPAGDPGHGGGGPLLALGGQGADAGQRGQGVASASSRGCTASWTAAPRRCRSTRRRCTSRPSCRRRRPHTLGTSDEAAIVLGSGLPDHLTDDELASVIGARLRAHPERAHALPDHAVPAADRGQPGGALGGPAGHPGAARLGPPGGDHLRSGQRPVHPQRRRHRRHAGQAGAGGVQAVQRGGRRRVPAPAGRGSRAGRGGSRSCWRPTRTCPSG